MVDVIAPNNRLDDEDDFWSDGDEFELVIRGPDGKRLGTVGGDVNSLRGGREEQKKNAEFLSEIFGTVARTAVEVGKKGSMGGEQDGSGI